MNGSCVICGEESPLIVNNEPLCKIHFIFGIWSTTTPFRVIAEPMKEEKK